MGLFGKVLDKFKQGLEKTREVFVTGASGLRNLLTGRKLDEALIAELEKTLLESDVGVKGTARLIDGIRADFKAGKMTRGEDVIEYLKRELKAMWPAEDRKLRAADSGPTVILVTGINGAGKTTSIAKLCHLLRSQNKTVLLAACDTFRAGAVRQLEIWAERLGVEVVKGQQGGDPASVAFDACKAAVARKIDYLIVDTAGRLHTQDPLMRQLTKIRQVISKQIAGAPHETILVLDATSGQNALRQAEEFDKAVGTRDQAPGTGAESRGTGHQAPGSSAESIGTGDQAPGTSRSTNTTPTHAAPASASSSPVPGAQSLVPGLPAPGITGIFLAKLDGTAKGGIVIAIRGATNIPVKFIGVGETPADIEPFDPEAFVEALFAA